MIGSFFGPSICQMIGLKWSFLIGCFTLSAFVFIQILPAWRQDQDEDSTNFFAKKEVVIVFLYAANFISGTGTAVLWTA